MTPFSISAVSKTLYAMRSVALMLLAWLPALSPAQTGGADEEIAGVVRQFFHALAAKDTTAMNALLLNDMVVVVNRMPETTGRGPITMQRGQFLQRIVATRQEIVERIGEPLVRQDSGIAFAWMDYEFLLDGVASHSGSNIFSLVRSGDRWMIASITSSMMPAVKRDP
jgi:ketosteroid isomerase-like protein